MSEKPSLDEVMAMWGMKYNVSAENVNRIMAEECCKYPTSFVRDHFLKEVVGYGNHLET